MRRMRINNPRYPHHVKVVRVTYSGILDRYDENAEPTKTVLYSGKGRCYTNGALEGRSVDMTHRYVSIPVRFDEWTGAKPSSGDTVEVEMGSIKETMTVKDFEPDNNRTVLYCERNGNLDL